MTQRRREGGLSVEIGTRCFFLPFDRVAFVAPIREKKARVLTMPRGELPLIDLRAKLGIRTASGAKSAVAVAGRFGFYAFGVDRADLVSAGSSTANLEPLDLDRLVSEAEERAMFPPGTETRKNR